MLAFQCFAVLLLTDTFYLLISPLNGSPLDGVPLRTDQDDPTGDDIEFDIADVVADFVYPTQTVTLVAFKVRSKTSSESPKWVSVGYPMLLTFNTSKGVQYFQSTPESIRFSIRTLTEQQKEALVKQAKIKYQNQASSINGDSFVRLPLLRFDCAIDFYMNGSGYSVRGSVYDLGTDPFKLELPLHEGDKKRVALEQRLSTADPVFFKCDMIATGKQEKINTLKITRKQVQDLGLTDKLLGPANERYVSRQQLTDLGAEVSSSLRIEETYEIDDDEFSDEFIMKILDMTHANFQPISVDEALKSLSQYGIQYDHKDLSPDEINKELSNVMEVRAEGKLDHIVLTKEGAERLATAEGHSGGGSVGIGVWGKFNLTGSANFANSKLKDWAESHKSIDDQLHELNLYGSDTVQWERDGQRIIPKSLNLAKVTKMALNSDMDFTRVKKRVSDAKYHRTPEISIRDAKAEEPSSWLETIQMLQKAIADLQRQHSADTKNALDRIDAVKAEKNGDIKKLWDDLNGYKSASSGETKKLWNDYNGYKGWVGGETQKIWNDLNGYKSWASGEINKLWGTGVWEFGHYKCRIDNACGHVNCGHC